MITFPTTAEAFIAYQENGINRKLDDLERKLADVVVGLVNGSYQEGIEGKENTVTIQLVRKFFKERNKELDEKFLRMWESICWWCNQAYQAGKEAQIEALRQIRDNPQATPGERLEAVKLLLNEMKEGTAHTGFPPFSV